MLSNSSSSTYNMNVVIVESSFSFYVIFNVIQNTLGVNKRGQVRSTSYFYAKQKHPAAIKMALPSKVESMLYISEYGW